MQSIEFYLTEDTAKIVKSTCIDRQEKRSMPQSCKGCPYRYRGEDTKRYCCMFSCTPNLWKDYTGAI